MALLNAADYPAVRAAIDVSLGAASLPDATIALDIYVGAAERAVLARDPDAATRTGTAAAHVKAAAIYLTAALLAPALPSITTQAFGGYQTTRQAFDGARRASELQQLASAELDSYLESGGVASQPTFFTSAAGRRGR